jgi:hypothetical protein
VTAPLDTLSGKLGGELGRHGHHQDCERLEQPQPSRVVVEKGCDLCDREDEHEVEEELERRHPLLALGRGFEQLITGDLVQHHGRRITATRAQGVPVVALTGSGAAA